MDHRKRSYFINILFNVLRICGVASFSWIDDGTQNATRTSIPLVCYCWFLHVVILLSNISGLYLHYFMSGREKLKSDELMWTSSELCCHIVVYLALANGKRNPSFNSYLRCLGKVEKELDGTFCSSFDVKFLGSAAFVLILIVGTTFSRFLGNLLNAERGYGDIHRVTGYFIYVQSLLVQMSITFSLYYPTRLMRALEAQVAASNINGNSRPDKTFLKDFQKLIRSQELLRDAARLVDDLANLPMLFILNFSFMSILYSCYTILLSIETKTYELNYVYIKALNNMSMLVLICETCQQFLLFDRRVSAQLREAARVNRCAGARELWSRTRGACARKPQFTAYRVFELNRSMLAGVIGTAVTYVVMMSQLRTHLKIKDNFYKL